MPFASVQGVWDMFLLAVAVKVEDGRPSLLAKLLSSSSVPELGHSSSSEGEKDFAPPEWDVPLSKNSVRKSRPWNYVTVSTSCPYTFQMPFNQPSEDFSTFLFPNMQRQIAFSRSPSRQWMRTLFWSDPSQPGPAPLHQLPPVYCPEAATVVCSIVTGVCSAKCATD